MLDAISMKANSPSMYKRRERLKQHAAHQASFHHVTARRRKDTISFQFFVAQSDKPMLQKCSRRKITADKCRPSHWRLLLSSPYSKRYHIQRYQSKITWKLLV